MRARWFIVAAALFFAPAFQFWPPGTNSGGPITGSGAPQFYVALPVANGGTGSDSNDCLSLSTQCATIAHARDLILQYDFHNTGATINVASTQSATLTGVSQSGTALTVGAVTSGQINAGDIVTCTDCPVAPVPLKIVSGSGLSWTMNQSATFGPESATTFTPIPGAQFSGALRGVAGGGISGQYLTINGAGSGNTYVGVISGKIFSMEFSNGFNAILQNMTIEAANNKYGLFVQNPGAVVQLGSGLNFIGDGSGAIGVHGEASSLVESAATNTINYCGSWNHMFAFSANAYLEFDPSGVGVLNGCSTNMTWFDVFNGAGQSNIVFPTGWTMTGFSATGGKAYVLQDAAVLNANSCLNNVQIVGTTPNIYQSARCSPSTPPTQSSTPTGCGTACAVTLAAGSGEHGGYISLATDPSGAGTFAGTGTISMTRAIQYKQSATNMAPCIFQFVNEAGFASWPITTTVYVSSGKTSGGITATWNTNGGGNLASNSTYEISYTCNGDR